VRVKRPAGARTGDHAQLLLLSTVPPSGRRVAATVRIGIVVVARIPGRLVHRLRMTRVRIRHRARRAWLELVVANRGNVDEWLGGGRLTLTLSRPGGKAVRLPVAARRVLARTSGIVEVRLPRWARRRVNVVVAIKRPANRVVLGRRRYRLRL
jgi:hypothetical protein